MKTMKEKKWENSKYFLRLFFGNEVINECMIGGILLSPKVSSIFCHQFLQCRSLKTFLLMVPKLNFRILFVVSTRHFCFYLKKILNLNNLNFFYEKAYWAFTENLCLYKWKKLLPRQWYSSWVLHWTMYKMSYLGTGTPAGPCTWQVWESYLGTGIPAGPCTGQFIKCST